MQLGEHIRFLHWHALRFLMYSATGWRAYLEQLFGLSGPGISATRAQYIYENAWSFRETVGATGLHEDLREYWRDIPMHEWGFSRNYPSHGAEGSHRIDGNNNPAVKPIPMPDEQIGALVMKNGDNYVMVGESYTGVAADTFVELVINSCPLFEGWAYGHLSVRVDNLTTGEFSKERVEAYNSFVTIPNLAINPGDSISVTLDNDFPSHTIPLGTIAPGSIQFFDKDHVVLAEISMLSYMLDTRFDYPNSYVIENSDDEWRGLNPESLEFNCIAPRMHAIISTSGRCVGFRFLVNQYFLQVHPDGTNRVRPWVPIETVAVGTVGIVGSGCDVELPSIDLVKGKILKFNTFKISLG